MKILTVVGARPQFIKAAPVSEVLIQAGIEEHLLHTGQHYDTNMSDVFFKELGLRLPNINLAVGSGSHAQQTAMMLVGVEKALIEQRPDWLLVYGDTNSTLAGVVAASKLNVPVAHVEAGLRSFNRRMPEEINRIVADALATLLFTPTETASNNLFREGIPSERVVQTGDVMLDACLMFRDRAFKQSKVLSQFALPEKGYILATIHRAENTDDNVKLSAIASGLDQVASQVPVLLPLHPRTRHRLSALRMGEFKNLRIVEPLGFLDMLRAEAGAALIVTDSGGVQKEAFFHKVPCITLREETEWIELIELGWNTLCDPISSEIIVQTVLSKLGTVGSEAFPYGSGNAAEIIVKALAGSTGA